MHLYPLSSQPDSGLFYIKNLSIIPSLSHRLEIHSHTAGLFFTKFGHLCLHDSIGSLTKIQHAGPMGSYDTGFVRVLLYNIPKHRALCRHIQRRGGLLQLKHRRIPELGSGNGTPLRLSF